MLTRNNDVAPQQKYYSDSLLQKPTVGQSVFDNMAMGFATTFIAANILTLWKPYRWRTTRLG
jgi:hypothetical protein